MLLIVLKFSYDIFKIFCSKLLFPSYQFYNVSTNDFNVKLFYSLIFTLSKNVSFNSFYRKFCLF